MRYYFMLVLCLLICSCKKEETLPAGSHSEKTAVIASPQHSLPPAVPLVAPPFLSKALSTAIVEEVNGALPVWRKFAKHRPLLAVVANAPALIPVPSEKREESRRLLKDGDDKSLVYRTGMDDPDPVFLPIMTVDAALDAGWFEGLIWIFPTTASHTQISLETFQRQLLENGIATETETTGLTLENGVIRGALRGRPFTAAPLSALPEIAQPIVLHLDCDYFKPIYKGEIKTPLYPIITELVSSIKAKSWKVATATIAHSNRGAGLPLQTRFIGGQLAEILTDPTMLDRPFPEEWAERANALYLENFMQKEKIKGIYEALEKKDPADPSLKYALYLVNRQFNRGDLALGYLDQAARIDAGYALEYLPLSELALGKRVPEQALKMLKLGRSFRPDDSFLLLHYSRTIVNAGILDDAAAISAELERRDWSEVYYPEVRKERDTLIQLLCEKR